MNRARLLLIERDCTLRLMIRQQLQKLDRLEVEVAEEANVGVDRATLGQFDLIIASMHMPDMPAGHLIDSLAAVRPKPVLIALAHPARIHKLNEEKVEALWDVLPLPLSRAALSSTIIRALRHHQETLCSAVLPLGAGHRARSSEVVSRKRKNGGKPVRLGHYEITELVGSGPKGTVYRGIDKRDSATVALRAIPREMVERLGGGTRWFERFTREASSASSVNHPHLAAILDHGFEENQRCLFVVNEFAEGVTLEKKLEDGPLEAKKVLKIAVETASALTAIHGAGFAHRLIRPSNIHLDGDGGSIVTDVGIAGMLAWDLMPLRPRLDRTPYLSPEQIRLGRVDDRSDQFSLGLVMFEALTGRYCVNGESPSAKVHELMARHPEISLDESIDEREQLTEILEKLIAKNPEERYQGDGELQSALKTCAEDLGIEF